VPLLLADIVGHALVEADDHVELPLARLDPKAAAQAFIQREPLAALKGLAGRPNGFDARGDERAEVVAQMVEGKEKPLTVYVGKVVGINDALLG